MATPKLVTDATTVFNEAQMNRAMMADGTKIQSKMWWGRINWSGSAAQVDSGTDSSGIVSASVAFDGGNTEFQMTLSGFTNPPVILCTPVGAAAYTAKVISTTNVLGIVGFFDIDTGAKIVTGVGDVNMDFNCVIIGE